MILNPRSSVFIRGQCSYMRLPRRVIEITQLDEAATGLVDLEDGCPGSVCFRGQRGDRPSISRAASRLHGPRGADRSQSLPQLLRCALRGGVSHSYRCAALHQENHDAKPDGLGADHPGRKHSRCKLFPRLSSGRAVRRRLRNAALQQTAHRHRTAAAAGDGSLPGSRRDARKEIEPKAQPENRMHRRGACVAGLRGGTGAAWVFRHGSRAARAARWIEYVRRGGVQAARARQSARSGVDRRAGRRVPLRGFDRER